MYIARKTCRLNAAKKGDNKKRILMSADFTKIQDATKKEWFKWEGEYKKMEGLDSRLE